MKRLMNWFASLLLLVSLASPMYRAFADSVNLINNPSAETLDSSGKALNWTADSWGTNTSNLTVSSDAHTGVKSLSVTTTAWTNGDSKWIPDAVSVTPGKSYTYSEYYKASTATEIDAMYLDASGATSYIYLSGEPATANWQQATINLTVPSTAQKVSILHILAGVGTLTTDDFNLNVPSVTVLPPPTSGNLIANPSFETPNGTTPANWQNGGWGTNATTYTYVTNDGHSGTHSAQIQTTSYTSGDAKWFFNPVTIQPNASYIFSDYFKSTIASSLVAQFDNGSGVLSYQTLASLSASSTWQQATTTFTTPATAKYVTVFHLISGVGTLQTDDASLTVPTVAPAPTVNITSPQANTTLSGSLTVSATGSASAGIANVQFKLDGVNLGSAVTTAPYQITWNTLGATNGTHNLTAVLTSTDAKTATSPAVPVTVNNQVATGGNLIPNPSFETVNSTNTKLPASWNTSSWGTNTSTFSYLTTGHTGTRSIKAQISSFTNGAAYWYVSPDQAVTPGKMYDFKNYYKSNIISEIDATITMSDGSVQYMYLGDVSPSPNSWTKFETQFTVPTGAKSLNIYQDIYGVGYVTSDDYSLTAFSYQGFTRPIISITADDGYASWYNYAEPILKKYNFKSTDYIITSYVDNVSGYMSSAMVKSMYANGDEVTSHTVDHPDLTTLSATAMDAELKDSQTFLKTLLGAGAPVNDFASPYGAYNQQVITDAAKYYQTYRGVQAGYNAKNNFDAMHLMVQNLDTSVTLAQVQAWIAEAKATNTWLILVYHQVDPSTASGLYNTYPTDFDAQLSAVKNSGIAVETVAQAMTELKPQL